MIYWEVNSVGGGFGYPAAPIFKIDMYVFLALMRKHKHMV